MAREKIGPETEVSTTELACVLGITGRRIRQLAEDGQLEKLRQGRFRLCDSVQRYVQAASDRAPSEEDADLNRSKLSAEVGYKQAKAKISQLEAQELEGKMHRSEDVAEMTEQLIFTIRGALMALPGRVAVDAAALNTAAEVSDCIRKEIHKIMRELADFKYDPQKYEERVRQRQNWEAVSDDREREADGC